MTRSIHITPNASAEPCFYRSHTTGSQTTFTISAWFKFDANEPQVKSIVNFGGSSKRVAVVVSLFSPMATNDISRSVFWVLDDEIISGLPWHHILLAVNTTLVTPSQRVRLYIDGVEKTYDYNIYPGLNALLLDAGTNEWFIGNAAHGATGADGISFGPFNGPIDELYFIDGQQLTPSSFITGTPGVPKAFTGAYGAAGFYLNFENNSSVVTLGYDASGHNYHWIPENINISDSSEDSADGVPLTVSDLIVGSPEFDAPPLTIADSLTASDLAVGLPELDAPLLQEALVAIDLVIGSPELGTPELSAVGENTLTAEDFEIGSPELGTPDFWAYVAGTLGGSWDATAEAVIGLEYFGSAGGIDEGGEAIALMDSPATGPFEISQTITKTAAEAQVMRVSFDVAPSVGSGIVEIGMSDDGSASAYAMFDVRTGECVDRGSTIDFHLLGVEADPVRFKFYRLTIAAETNASSTLKAYIRLCDDSYDPSYTSTEYSSNRVLVSNPLLFDGMDAANVRWEIGPPEMRFYWTVHVGTLGLLWFRCGENECGIDPHLRILTAPELECILYRWGPAQDQIVLDYSGMIIAGSGDPMAGTP